jgi:CopG-like RHH_1 or ribbon-helix-helix domain, RHH_5
LTNVVCKLSLDPHEGEEMEDKPGMEDRPERLVGFRMPAALYEAFEREARLEQRTVSGMLRVIVSQWVAAREVVSEDISS